MRFSVYWITDDTNKDIYNYGYVGVTSQGVDKRFSQHVYLANNKRKRSYYKKLSQIIRENKENLKVVTLCDCGKEYALFIENKLRPNIKIGWNSLSGGKFIENTSVNSGHKNPNYIDGRSIDQTKRHKEVVLLREKGEYVRPTTTGETKLKISKIHSGKTKSEDNKRKISESKLKANKMPWENGACNSELWKNAQHYHELWLSNSKCNSHTLHKIIGLGKSTFNIIVKLFKSGWIPREDMKWNKHNEY